MCRLPTLVVDVGHSRLSRASRYCSDVRYAAESGSKFSRHTVARRVRYAAPVFPISLSRIARRSVSPFSVPTSSAPMSRL